MPISMYKASAPRFANTLKNLSAILGKAQAHCEARKIDPLDTAAYLSTSYASRRILGVNDPQLEECGYRPGL